MRSGDTPVSKMISETFSAAPKPKAPTMPAKPQAFMKPEPSRNIVPLPTAALVQSIVWGNGTPPPVPTPGGPVQAPAPEIPMSEKGQPGSFPTSTKGEGTTGALDPVDKGWGQV